MLHCLTVCSVNTWKSTLMGLQEDSAVFREQYCLQSFWTETIGDYLFCILRQKRAVQRLHTRLLTSVCISYSTNTCVLLLHTECYCGGGQVLPHLCWFSNASGMYISSLLVEGMCCLTFCVAAFNQISSMSKCDSLSKNLSSSLKPLKAHKY